MMLDYDSGVLTVIEDTTGEVLTTIRFDPFDEDPPAQVLQEDNTITITDTEGNPVFVFTEEEADAAYQEVEREELSVPQAAVAFSPDGDEWFSATTSGLDLAWAQAAAVGTDAVVIFGESTDVYFEESGHSVTAGEATVTLTGDGETVVTTVVPAEPGFAAETYVWVGRLG